MVSPDEVRAEEGSQQAPIVAAAAERPALDLQAEEGPDDLRAQMAEGETTDSSPSGDPPTMVEPGRRQFDRDRLSGDESPTERLHTDAEAVELPHVNDEFDEALELEESLVQGSPEKRRAGPEEVTQREMVETARIEQLGVLEVKGLIEMGWFISLRWISPPRDEEVGSRFVARHFTVFDPWRDDQCMPASTPTTARLF